jgi:predicted acyl esterase
MELAKYKGYSLTSQYVTVRDGTKLAVDLYRPKTRDRKLVEERLPVLFMHTPYNRRYFKSPTAGAGLTAETYPGFAARMDAYDIIEWLAAQPWAADRVGMWGSSASLRDASAAPIDGDEGRSQLLAAIAEYEGSVENPGYVPFRDSVAQNIPEQWWIKSSPHTYAEAIHASGIAFHVAADWNEAATKYGAFFTFKNVASKPKLIVGPGEHCAWLSVEKHTGFDIAVEELRFFDHHLKGAENGVPEEPRVYYYTYNEPEASSWRRATDWPLPNEQRTPFFLSEKQLGTTQPRAAEASNQTAVEYAATAPNDGGRSSYETAPLAAAVRVTGHPVAELWVSSSATDGDFIASLEDVSPDGATVSYNVHGRLRASLRAEADPPYDNLGLPWHSFCEADAEPLTPGQPTKLRFDLLPLSVRFARGHRIRRALTFADAVTPQVQPAPTAKVYRDAAHPPSITLPIIPD